MPDLMLGVHAARFKGVLEHYEVKIWLAAMDLDVSDVEASPTAKALEGTQFAFNQQAHTYAERVHT